MKSDIEPFHVTTFAEMEVSIFCEFLTLRRSVNDSLSYRLKLRVIFLEGNVLYLHMMSYDEHMSLASFKVSCID